MSPKLADEASPAITNDARAVEAARLLKNTSDDVIAMFLRDDEWGHPLFREAAVVNSSAVLSRWG